MAQGVGALTHPPRKGHPTPRPRHPPGFFSAFSHPPLSRPLAPLSPPAGTIAPAPHPPTLTRPTGRSPLLCPYRFRRRPSGVTDAIVLSVPSVAPSGGRSGGGGTFPYPHPICAPESAQYKSSTSAQNSFCLPLDNGAQIRYSGVQMDEGRGTAQGA